MTSPLRGLLSADVSVATAGVSLFADALRSQAVAVTEAAWQPPMDGTAADLATRRSPTPGTRRPTPRRCAG